MHRCYAPPSRWGSRPLELDPEEAHHLQHVLRAAAGDAVGVFDGQGREALARVAAAQGGRVSLEILEVRSVPRGRIGLHLIQALPKGNRMDLIVEKATELGVSSVTPVITDRVVAQVGSARRDERRQRWQRVALSAAKQCGASWVPEVRPVLDFADMLRGLRGLCDLFLVGSLDPRARRLQAVLAEIRAGSPPPNLGLLIGPEGDFTPQEHEAALAAGGVAVSFGALVFRVETAALFGLSVLAYETAAT